MPGGLSFNMHGASLSGPRMSDNTKLHELVPLHGFVVVHPSAMPDKIPEPTGPGQGSI